jgi:glycosyltransferase involved in cell wall biosynthesis
MPNAGGFHLDHLESLRRSPPSGRSVIMVKGYQGVAGRGLVALRALSRAADLLGKYEVVVYSCADDSVKVAARLLAGQTGIRIRLTILPPRTPHARILEYHGRARLSIGLSISDAISTSFLEALVMGSFPIQSWTSAADEWIQDGLTGLLVPPEDSDAVERAVRRALAEDLLVDRAAALNWETAQRRMRYEDLRDKALAMYREVYEEIRR